MILWPSWHPGYKVVKDLIVKVQFEDAIRAYYVAIGNRPFGELTPELLYLKRLGNIPVSGRDLLFFKNNSSMTNLIRENIWEYCSCIEQVIEEMTASGRMTALDILVESVPTLAGLIKRTNKMLNKRVRFSDGIIQKNTTEKVELDYFGLFVCPKGRLFDRYPNTLIQHFDEETADEWVRQHRVWVTCSPSVLSREIRGKGFQLGSIDVYKHKGWRRWRSDKREPDFTTVTSEDEIEVSQLTLPPKTRPS